MGNWIYSRARKGITMPKKFYCIQVNAHFELYTEDGKYAGWNLSRIELVAPYENCGATILDAKLASVVLYDGAVICERSVK
jgi:hypothetical protein